MHHRPLEFIRRDPAVRESLLVSAVLLLLSGGLSLLLSWLWVWRWALVRRRQPVDGVILVCGHRLEQGQPSADYIRRLRRAAELMQAERQLELILLGGGMPSEASAGRDWLLAHASVEPGRIRLEERSADSLENLRNARAMVDSDTLYVLSSRYHLGRLKAFASQLGLRAEMLAAEARFRPGWRNLALSLREAAYVCWFASGRLWARLARRQHLLERIR